MAVTAVPTVQCKRAAERAVSCCVQLSCNSLHNIGDTRFSYHPFSQKPLLLRVVADAVLVNYSSLFPSEVPTDLRVYAVAITAVKGSYLTFDYCDSKADTTPSYKKRRKQSRYIRVLRVLHVANQACRQIAPSFTQRVYIDKT